MNASNVVAQRVDLEIQRGATTPQISFRLKQKDGSYLDFTTIYAFRMAIRNQAGKVILELEIGGGLTITTPAGGANNTMLVMDHVYEIPPSTSYSYDTRLFLTEFENFVPSKGAVKIIETITG